MAGGDPLPVGNRLLSRRDVRDPRLRRRRYLRHPLVDRFRRDGQLSGTHPQQPNRARRCRSSARGAADRRRARWNHADLARTATGTHTLFAKARAHAAGEQRRGGRGGGSAGTDERRSGR